MATRPRYLLFPVTLSLSLAFVACGATSSSSDDATGDDGSVSSDAADRSDTPTPRDVTTPDATTTDADGLSDGSSDARGLDGTTLDSTTDGGTLDSATDDGSMDLDAAPDVDAGPTCTPAPRHSTGTTSSNWQVDSLHSGYQPNDEIALPLCARWSRNFHSFIATPLIVDGRAFVVLLYGPTDGLSALDLATGVTLWGPVTAGTGARIEGSAYGDGQVYTIASNDLLEAWDPATGALRWSLALPHSRGSSSPVTANGMVYVAGDEATGTGGTLYAVSKDGVLVWSYDLAAPAYGPATVTTDGKIYLDDGCQSLYALDAMDGGVSWHRAGVCADDRSEPLPLLFSQLFTFVAPSVQTSGFYPSGNLILNASDGSDAGAYRGLAAPARDNSRVFINDPSSLTAIDPLTHGSIWTLVGQEGLIEPLVIGSRVFVARSQLLVVDAATGSILDSTLLPASPQPLYGEILHANMAEADGILLVPTQETLTAY